MAKPLKPLDEVDWEVASRHLIEAFPGATLGDVVARAEMAATTLDLLGKVREAECMRRAAKHIRSKIMN